MYTPYEQDHMICWRCVHLCTLYNVICNTTCRTNSTVMNR